MYEPNSIEDFILLGLFRSLNAEGLISSDISAILTCGEDVCHV